VKDPDNKNSRALLDKDQAKLNHKRVSEISTEMSNLLDQQREFLNNAGGALTKKMSPEEINGYAERNERLRELCVELNKLG
jgi:hypothetical protein